MTATSGSSRDRVWLWASWGQNDINNVAAGGVNDRTILENTAVKLNAQFTASNSFVGSFNNGEAVMGIAQQFARFNTDILSMKVKYL